ncbi:ribose-phosphate pyrophosphokinase [Candidatus Marinamargulisbacteria bacterium SCGC AG-410-N11]|nr:ribose-phosphate pyrophosphokinase [Candidatus Marinamargulisbacteria bacterium SCGC AG-410-N11]
MNGHHFSKMKLFCGSSHQELGTKVANELGIKLGKVQLSTFSCGELYARIEETIRGKEAFILQTITQEPNNDYMELFLMIDALKRSSASKIHVIIPHFGYARQDKKSAPREPISSRLISDLLSAVGFNRLITMDLHSDQIQGFFNQPVDHLTALPLFIDHFSKKNISDLVVVAPDTGRAKFAKRLADKLHASLAVMHKTRPNHNQAEITNVIGDVEGKNVLIVDDMVDTGGSVISGIKALKEFNCKDAYLATTHAVFSGPCIDRLKNSDFKEIVITDTIPPSEKIKTIENLSILSTAKTFAETIKRNYENKSISSLFA